MGEGVLVILGVDSMYSLGGSSKNLGSIVSMGLDGEKRIEQGRGFPGSSSHLNGTDAKVCSGGVSAPGCSGDCMTRADNFGSRNLYDLKLLSDSHSNPMIIWLYVREILGHKT